MRFTIARREEEEEQEPYEKQVGVEGDSMKYNYIQEGQRERRIRYHFFVEVE